MTREEKIEKVLHDCSVSSNEYIARRIVEALDEPQERWLAHELVFDAQRYGYFQTQVVDKEAKIKLDPLVLAATIGARIKDAKWAAVDKENVMFFFEEEPKKMGTRYEGEACCDIDGDPYHIPCKVTDWTQARWELKELEE